MGDNTPRRSVAALDSRSPVTMIRHDIRASGQRRRRGRPPRRHSEQRPPAGPVDFAPHDIDANFRGGYAVVGRRLQQGRQARRHRQLARRQRSWPGTRTRRGRATSSSPETQQIVNQAMADIDGDGIPEIAFQSSFAMQPANSAGLNWIAHAQRRPAPAVEGREDRCSSRPRTTSRGPISTATARRNCSTRRCIGEKGVAPTYDQDKASVFWYSPKDWKRTRRHDGHSRHHPPRRVP